MDPNQTIFPTTNSVEQNPLGVVDAEVLESGDSALAVEILDAEVLDSPQAPAQSLDTDRPSGPVTVLIVRPIQFVFSVVDYVFGLASLIFFLAVVASIPLLQFVSLGYLLEASGRAARSGRLRDGLFGVRLASRFGTAVAGCLLMILPVWYCGSVAVAAEIIEPGGAAARGWRIGTIILSVLVLIHAGWAVYRGGRPWHFLWPAPLRFIKTFFTENMYVQARERVWEITGRLRIPFFFWLGVRGFAGAFIWLLIPTSFLIAGTFLGDGAPILGIIGALQLTLVIIYLPFLQTNLAAENRFASVFDFVEVHKQMRRAPLCLWLSLLVTLLFALPLYLLKIEATQTELTWIASLVFVASILPARLLTGWAVGRANKREKPAFFLWRWPFRIAAIPVAAMYVLIVFASQYVSWHGQWSLYEQHAFLLPVPFFSL